MFSKRYERLNNYITPSSELVNKVKNLSETRKNKSHILLKPAIAMMTLILTYCSMPVLAANVPIIYNLMYQVSPSVAQYFMPVQKTCESNGIEMEVVSAYIKDDTAQIYITLKDLKENRVDETTDLNDSYKINRAFDCSIGHCENVGYDAKTGKATFLITITNNEKKNITGEKLTFMMSNFISHKKKWDEIKLPISTKQIESNIKTQKIGISGFSTTNDKYQYKFKQYEEDVIIPNKDIDFGVNDMRITGIAYLDNRLHIQVSAKNNFKIDNHGEIYLKNIETNEKKLSDYHVGFVLGKKGDKYEYSTKYYTHNEDRRDFTEYVFDISKEELKNYNIYGDFVAGGLNTEGDWKITFPLEAQ